MTEPATLKHFQYDDCPPLYYLDIFEEYEPAAGVEISSDTPLYTRTESGDYLPWDGPRPGQRVQKSKHEQMMTPAPVTIPQSMPVVKTMADLLTTVYQPIRWVISPILPEGLAILSGPPKIGKSWLVMNLCLASATGGLALGKFLVDAGEVLLLSLEDNERRLQGRLKKCLAGATHHLTMFHAITTWKRLDQGGLADLASWLTAHPGCKLVVIDTIQKIKPHPKRNSGNAYENDYDAYGELQRLALNHCCCILVIHHNRKSDSKNDGDPLEQISGSTGITGAMDTILMLRRPRGATGAVLTATGRDIPEAEFAMTFNGNLGQWVVVEGQASELSLQDKSLEIINILKGRIGEALSVGEINDRLAERMDAKSLKTKLYRLRDKGILTGYKGKFLYINNDTNDTNDNNDIDDTDDTKPTSSITSITDGNADDTARALLSQAIITGITCITESSITSPEVLSLVESDLFLEAQP